MNKQMKNFGKKVKDKHNGYTGIVIGYANYMYSGESYLVAPICENPTKFENSTWIEIDRLELID
jgi:hypothetical protein